jgi:hypothetical protein
MDWWGHAPYYSGLQVLQEAIEKAGTLDHKKLSEYIKPIISQRYWAIRSSPIGA